MLKIIDKIIVSDQAPKGKNVLWLHPTEKGYQIKVNSGGGYTTINTGSSEEHEYVDLGLPSGTLWATCNIGATKPEEYGNYYAWGEIETKDEYISENSLTYNKEIPNISGNPLYDAARVHWGGSWRIPTNTEFQELIDNCTWEWVIQNNVTGYKVMGNNNFIFLPASGMRDLSQLNFDGIFGSYRSSTPYEKYNFDSYDFHCDINGKGISYESRYLGKSVRPVKSK